MLFKISLIFVYLVGLSSLIPPIQSQDSPQDYLDAHNAARATVGVSPLTWDTALIAYPENYANKRANTDCALVHSEGPYSENLAGSSGPLSGTDAVSVWVSEKDDYDYISNTCAAGRVCKHYLQVVWQNTVRLGCVKGLCNNGSGTFVSCNYYPRGIIAGERPYENNQLAPAPAPPDGPSFAGVTPSWYKGLLTLLTVGAGLLILVLSLAWAIYRWTR